MAKHTLVAVGGSGQSAVIAYLRLATISGMSPEFLPNIYVIDADIKDRQGADAKPSLFSSLKVLFTQLTQGVAEIHKPKLELIYPYDNGNSNESLSNSTVFADYVLSKGGQKEDMRYVVDALFSKKGKKSNEHVLSEQDVPLSKGFMARPNVGATTFFDKLHQGKRNLEPALNRLHDSVIHAQNQNVTVVVGSSFGGTGSGVAPALAQQLARWAEDAHQTPRIGLFMTLPWFNPIAQKTHTNAPATHGSSETQRRNTAGGLRYYATSKAFKQFDVFIADYCGHVQVRNDDSNSEQPEYEHVFNILLAAQIQNYFINKLQDPKFIEKTAAYTFYQPQQSNAQLSFDAKDSALLSFAGNKELKQDLQNWAHEAQSLRLALRYTSRFILNDFKLTDASKRDVPSGFVQLALAVAQKDGRPSAVVPKSFFKKETASPEIYREIAKKLLAREQQLGGSIAWLNTLSNNCPELKIDDASVQANPDGLYTSYVAMKKERTVEVAAIRLFEEAMELASKKNILQPFENRMSNGQHVLDAAAEEIESHIRQLIRKESAVPRQHDEAVSYSESSGVLLTPFIPMQVGNSGHVVNSYLQRIELNTLVDDGKNRHGEGVSVHDKNHPASLNELSHFSIPSPWGAALVEQWNQESAFNGLKTNPSLFDHSAARLEAVLWAIFTKRLIVKNIDGRNTGSIANTAIQVRNIESALRDQHADYTISVAVNPLNGQLIAANYPSVAWFATPSLAGTLHEWWDDDELALQLPTEMVYDAKKVQPTSYEARQIKSFSAWLKTLLDLHGEASSAATVSWFHVLQHIYNRLIAHILPETLPLTLPETGEYFLLQIPNNQVVQAPVLQVAESVSEIVEKACCPSLIVLEDRKSDGDYLHQIPDSPLKTKAQGKATLKEHSAVLRGRNSNDNYMNLIYELELPEGKFTVKRKAKIVSISVQQVIWPNFKVDGWKFYFASGTATDNTDLVNQADPRYAYHLYSQQENGEKKPVLYMQDGVEKEFNQPLWFDRNYEIYGVPDVLVLLERIAGTDQYQEVGIINTGLKRLPDDQKNRFKLALDFGTSHSCVVALDASDRKIDLVDFTRPSSDNELLSRVIQTPAGDDYLFNEFRFIAPFAAGQSNRTLDRNVLPSEFRFNRELSNANPVKDMDAGVRYLTILPMQFQNPTAEKSIKSTGTIGDVKWGASKKSSSLTGTVYEGEEANLSRQYIKQMVRMALARLRVQGYSHLATFRATFPEAFTTQHTNLFAEELDQVFTQLVRETGLRVDQPITREGLLRLKDFIEGTDQKEGQGLDANSHGLVSESVSALETALKTSERNALSDKQLQIVLDMGGGSTDVAAFLNADLLRLQGEQKLPFQLTDSIRYAGHDILQLLSTPEVTKVLDDQIKLTDPNNMLQQCLRVIKIAMRDAKAVHRLQTRLVENNFAVNTKRNIKDFFEGLFEYTRQLIFSYQHILKAQGVENLSIGIVLLGNGWRLGNLVYTNADLNTVDGLKHEMQEYLKNGLAGIDALNIIFPSSSSISVKESIAYGSLLYNPEEVIAKTTGESALARTRFSFIGESELQVAASHLPYFLTQQKAAYRRSGTAPQIEKISNFPPNSNFLYRMNSVKGQEGQGLHFAKIDLNKRLQIQWRSSEEEILISPMKEFLECIWKPLLLEDSN